MAWNPDDMISVEILQQLCSMAQCNETFIFIGVAVCASCLNADPHFSCAIQAFVCTATIERDAGTEKKTCSYS